LFHTLCVDGDCVDCQTVRALQAALEATRLLQERWRAGSREALDDDGDYSPERIDWAIRHWPELESAAEGGAAAPWGRTSGGGDRMALASLLSDIQRAAELVLAPYPHWTSARRLLARMGLEVPPYRWPAGAAPAPAYPFSHQVPRRGDRARARLARLSIAGGEMSDDPNIDEILSRLGTAAAELINLALEEQSESVLAQIGELLGAGASVRLMVNTTPVYEVLVYIGARDAPPVPIATFLVPPLPSAN
jgi:hypothetical protein